MQQTEEQTKEAPVNGAKIKVAIIEAPPAPEETVIGKMNILVDGGMFMFFNDIVLEDKLEVGVYELQFSKTGLYLTIGDDLRFPDKVYDTDKDFRKQIFTVFNKLDKNIGVLLDGYKGMGKSVLAKQLCLESNLPVIMINKSVPLMFDLNNFLSKIKQPFVLFIDEFEKRFKKASKDNDPDLHTEDSFLSIMDGAQSGTHKKLFILTTNDSVGDKFINRPSRIRYYKNYEFISDELYNMIIDDKLNNSEFKQDLIENLPLLECSIDLLNTIIEEINTVEMPYSKFKAYFNHKPRKILYSRYRQNEKGEWEYYDSFETDHEITRSTTQINNDYRSKGIFHISGEDMFYKSTEYMIDTEGEKDEDGDYPMVNKEVVYKIRKNKGGALPWKETIM